MEKTKQPVKRAFLFSLRADGSPTCHPMTAIYREGIPTFNTYAQSTKARNLQRDPRAAAVVLDNWKVEPASAVRISGRAEPAREAWDPAQPPPDVLEVSRGITNLVTSRVDEGKRIVFALLLTAPAHD